MARIVDNRSGKVSEQNVFEHSEYVEESDNVPEDAPEEGDQLEQYLNNTLTELNLPTVTSFSKTQMFTNMNTLVSAKIPNLTSIPGYTFSNCSNLVDVELSSNLTDIGLSAFGTCTKLCLEELPSGVTSIGGSAFYRASITLKELPSELTNIGESAFYMCSKIDIKEIPSKVTTIYANAFANSALNGSITFKGKPSSIASTAFDGCSKITTINVPWAQGEVANAPWGAKNATINYNYTGE